MLAVTSTSSEDWKNRHARSEHAEFNQTRSIARSCPEALSKLIERCPETGFAEIRSAIGSVDHKPTGEAFAGDKAEHFYLGGPTTVVVGAKETDRSRCR